MAIVRELTTVLDFKEDMTGLNRYEAGLSRIKEITKGVLGAVGITLALDKVIEFVDGLVDAGKEVNRLSAQLKVIARPFDDMDEAQARVFEGAQTLGLEYKEILGTFKEMYNELRGTTTPVGEIEDATTNIYKALRVGRASAEEMHQTFELLNRSFRRGGIRSMGVGVLQDIAPRVFDILGQKLVGGDRSKWEDGLRRLGKEGKLTAEVLIDAFSQANESLDKEFAAVPQKLGWVFTRIYNDLTKLTSQIYKMVDASVALGHTVWWVYSRFRDLVVRLTTAVGGLKNVIEILGIAIATYLLRNLLLLSPATWAIVAANFALIATYVLMAAAVVAVAVAIQDLVYWIMGKPSLISTWIGPFKDLKKNFENLNIFAGPRVFQDLFRGDFKKAWEDLKLVFTEVDAGMFALIATATLVKAVLMGWNLLKFTALIAEIGLVQKAVELLSIGIQAAIRAVEASLVGTRIGMALFLMQMAYDLYQKTKEGGLLPRDKPTGPDADRSWLWDQLKNLFGVTPPPSATVPVPAAPVVPGAQQPPAPIPDLSWLLGGLQTPFNQPALPLGAMVPASRSSVVVGDQNVNTTQNNTVNITGVGDDAIASQVENSLKRLSGDLASGIGREIAGSAPRIEAPIR